MSLKKSGWAWLLSVAIATALVLTPSEARADNDTVEALPFMVFAAAFTTFIIVYAINNPADRSSEDDDAAEEDAGDDTSANALRNAHEPMRPAPILGFSGRF